MWRIFPICCNIWSKENEQKLGTLSRKKVSYEYLKETVQFR